MRQIKRTIRGITLMSMLGLGGWFTADEIKAGDHHGTLPTVSAIGKCTHPGCSCREFSGVYRYDRFSKFNNLYI